MATPSVPRGSRTTARWVAETVALALPGILILALLYAVFKAWVLPLLGAWLAVVTYVSLRGQRIAIPKKLFL